MLRVAERRKRTTYPELSSRGPQRLLVLGSEIGGRWNETAQWLVRDLVRIRAQRAPPAKQRGRADCLCASYRHAGRRFAFCRVTRSHWTFVMQAEKNLLVRDSIWLFSASMLADAGVLELPTSSGCWHEHTHAIPCFCSVQQQLLPSLSDGRCCCRLPQPGPLLQIYQLAFRASPIQG